jgi:intracellular sulfur oxidation DsrE/DsrF family protein
MKKIIIITVFLYGFLANSQENRTTKNVIEDYGKTFAVENPDLLLDKNKVYKIIFDIYTDAKDDSKINPLLNTVARFINMHTETGVPLENLKIVVILHGKATKDVLSNEAFLKKYKKENPNTALLKVLNSVNVNAYVCGQSYAYKAFDRAELDNNVKMSLSALTTLVKYQSEGYQLITFN